MKAAFYECDVTPPLGGYMWGHYQKLIAKDVIDRLYVKSLVVEDNGEIAAIVCIDSCSIPPEMHDIVTKRIFEYTGIPAERVCITSNHTHWGVPISDAPEIRCFADKAYCDVFYRIVADAVTLAYMRLDDAQAKFGLSEVNGISFCRDYVLEGGKTITFGKPGAKMEKMLAEIDPSLSVMTFERNGEPIGAIINFACHQCCCGSIEGYSGDYSSILSKELKKKFGNDFVSLFVLGTCGDINHLNTDSSVEIPQLWYREMGRRIAAQTLTAMDNSAPVSGCIECFKTSMTIEKRQADPEYIIERMETYLAEGAGDMMRMRNLVHYAATNEEKEYEVKVQAIRIGNVCIYALPGEVFVNFGFRLKNESCFENNIVIENCNCYCGYIPSKEAFAKNCDLYETYLCHHSCLVPEAGDMIVDKLLGIANGFKK